MSSDDLRKRRACQNCTKAKAKCSPSDNADICYRCKRLNKECIADEIVRKRGPKTRSRVKQLEQRVDSLIGLLAANGQPAGGNEVLAAVTSISSDTSPEATLAPNETSQAPIHYITPVETPDRPATETLRPQKTYYDPIEDGVIDHAYASILLDEFRTHCVLSFPFVVIPQTAGVDNLRHRLPFLFLAIMAVMTYRQPAVQRKLGDELKHQVSVRIIDQSQRSLEILEGILLYSAWYHSFYRPQSQILATMLQLCVAMVRDLGLSKNLKDKVHKYSPLDEECGVLFRVERSTAEKRALLGTYYLNVAYSQTWRHHSAYPFSKYMDQCCKSLAEQKEEPTDELIAPLFQISALIDRVSNHFSYYDVDNADVKGDLMLEMSANSFRSELKQLEATVPFSFRDNKSVVLMFNLAETWIHDCCLHPSLWDSPQADAASAISPCRLKMLNRALDSMKLFMNNLIETPDQTLYHLAIFPLAGWFYSNVVACKVVFLQDNERPEQKVCTFMPEEFHNDEALDNQRALREVAAFKWDPALVAQETGIQTMFERFIGRLRFTFPPGGMKIDLEMDDRDVLFNLACIQLSILNGFTKRIKENSSKPDQAPNDPSPTSNDAASTNLDVDVTLVAHAEAPPSSSSVFINSRIDAGPDQHTSVPQVPLSARQVFLRQKVPAPSIPYMNFDGLNFESVQSQSEDSDGIQGVTMGREYEDWVWNMMMDDFTLLPP